MIRNNFLWGSWGWLAAVMAAASASAAVSELKDVRLTGGAQSAQVTLVVSNRTAQRLFTLKKPDRVVLDLRDTRLANRLRAPAGAGPVEIVRLGAPRQNTVRVVIQLKSALPMRGAWLDDQGEPGAQFAIAVGREAVAALGRTRGGVATTGDGASSPQQTAAADPQPVRAAHAPRESDRDVIVAVDAGHGGQDPGASGRGGTREKDVVLAIARALAARINAEPGMRAVLTRDSDRFLMLRERIQLARGAKADLFVSVHADSIRDRAVSGASVYVLSEKGATNEAARWLAERENAADLMGGVSLTDKDNTLASVLLDLSQSASISASMTAAERVLTALDRVGEVRKSQVQQAGFVVLKSPDIPSMLVETAYISNPAEEKRLKSPPHQEKLANAIYNGLYGYFENNPPPGTRFASLRRATVASIAAAP